MPEVSEKKITLPTSLALKIAKILRDKYKIDHWKNGFDDTFTTEELSKITSLKLENPSPRECVGMDLLPNLKELSLIGRDVGKYTIPQGISSINDGDIACIAKCKNLETLVIHKQPKISYLDVSKLTKLKELDICENHQLQEIEGIDAIKELSFFSCYGNEALSRIENLDKVIEKGSFFELDLDVLLFPSAIGYTDKGYDRGNYNEKAVGQLSLLGSSCTWSQSFGSKRNDRIKISHDQMLQMHNKSCQILSQIANPNASTREQVMAIETYLAENVQYDTAAAYEREDHTSFRTICKDPKYGELVEQLGPKHGTNGSYNCIVHNLCVCEGYTRGEQYLLALCGIKSHNVHCLAGIKDELGMSDYEKEWKFQPTGLKNFHSIICIEDQQALYSDPCWNAGRWQRGDKSMPYSLRTKEEISETHTLSFEERSIGKNATGIAREHIEEAILRNALFKKTKMSEVEAQRKQLGQQRPLFVRGMIPDWRD